MHHSSQTMMESGIKGNGIRVRVKCVMHHCVRDVFYMLEIKEINDLQPLIILESAEPLAAYTNIHQHTHTLCQCFIYLMFNSRDLLAIYVFRNASL